MRQKYTTFLKFFYFDSSAQAKYFIVFVFQIIQNFYNLNFVYYYYYFINY